MDSTVVISIGRNVANVPLTASQWRAFKNDVEYALQGAHAIVLQEPLYSNDVSTQYGKWEGMTEQSAVWIVLCQNTHIVALRHKLNIIRSKFAQDAIGFIVKEGDCHLITGL